MAQQRQQGKEAHGTAAGSAGPPYRTLLEFAAWSVAEAQAQELNTPAAPCAGFLRHELPSVQDAAKRIKVPSYASVRLGQDLHRSYLQQLWGPYCCRAR